MSVVEQLREEASRRVIAAAVLDGPEPASAWQVVPFGSVILSEDEFLHACNRSIEKTSDGISVSFEKLSLALFGHTIHKEEWVSQVLDKVFEKEISK